MMNVLITNEKDEEQYKIEVCDYLEAKEWIADHNLDLSKQWSVTDIGDDGSGV
jgi:hypothetical protein